MVKVRCPKTGGLKADVEHVCINGGLFFKESFSKLPKGTLVIIHDGELIRFPNQQRRRWGG